MTDWRAWVGDAVGGGTVMAVRRLHGGITSVVHAVDVEDRRGRRHRLVLRRYPAGGILDSEPWLVDREVRALTALADARVADVPRLVAVDAGGGRVGRPAVLSTRLPGRPVLAPTRTDHWIEGLADAVTGVLDSLRGVDAHAVGTYAAWYDVGSGGALEPPPWVRAPERWRRAVAPVAAALPASRSALQVIHRDLNPGNVLWRRGKVTGVVDWVHLCTGPIEEDIGRCRLNVAVLVGLDAADRFLDAVESRGFRYEPAWDQVVAGEMAPWYEGFLEASRLGAQLTTAVVRRRVEAFVTRSA